MAARTTATRTPKVDVRTLRVKDNKGTFEITIPADWRVTFSTFKQGQGFDNGAPALRIYEAENKQRACFVNVQSFYDTALPIKREVISESGEVSWQEGPDGFERRQKVTRTKKQVEF